MANRVRKRERTGEHECTCQNYGSEFHALCPSRCFGFQKSCLTSLNARLFCDPIVKRLNFLVEHFESALTAYTVPASCGGLASRYCLNELLHKGAAIFVLGRMAHPVPRRSRQPKMRGGNR
jgi:hypothetical protein